jgi:hypothetical protein
VRGGSAAGLEQELHTRVAEQIPARHHAQRSGFRRNLQQAVQSAGYGLNDGDGGLPEIPRIIPDVHLVERDEYAVQVTVWEVVISHPLSDEKLEIYASFWGALSDSSAEVYFHLREVDRFGGETNIDLMPWYAKAIAGDREAPLLYARLDGVVSPPPEGWEEQVRQAIDRRQQRTRGGPPEDGAREGTGEPRPQPDPGRDWHRLVATVRRAGQKAQSRQASRSRLGVPEGTAR